MNETGAIDDQQYATAIAEPVVAKRFGAQRQLEAFYVAEMVRAEMVARFGTRGYDGRAQSDDHHRQPSASGGQSRHPRTR